MTEEREAQPTLDPSEQRILLFRHLFARRLYDRLSKVELANELDVDAQVMSRPERGPSRTFRDKILTKLRPRYPHLNEQLLWRDPVSKLIQSLQVSRADRSFLACALSLRAATPNDTIKRVQGAFVSLYCTALNGVVLDQLVFSADRPFDDELTVTLINADYTEHKPQGVASLYMHDILHIRIVDPDPSYPPGHLTVGLPNNTKINLMKAIWLDIKDDLRIPFGRPTIMLRVDAHSPRNHRSYGEETPIFRVVQRMIEKISVYDGRELLTQNEPDPADVKDLRHLLSIK